MPPQSAFSASIRRYRPGFVRIIFLHCLGNLCGSRTEVLLINAALLVHDEGHDARISVFGGPGYEGEAGDHVAVDDVIVPAARRVFALALENLEKVAVERLRAFGV